VPTPKGSQRSADRRLWHTSKVQIPRRRLPGAALAQRPPATFWYRSAMPWNLEILGRRSPGGRFENSPPFQGWDCRTKTSRPEGTPELLPQNRNRIARTTFAGFSRPFGTDDVGPSDPALKRWAILSSPSGRRKA